MISLINVGIMTVVGSVIAGSTNHLAIQMLFRPYEAKYIGKWKVPFTPGLIPSRRGELALQLGNTVEEYLFTPEMLRKKIINTEMEEKLTETLKGLWLTRYIENEKTIDGYLNQFNKASLVDDTKGKIDKIVKLKVQEFTTSLGEKSVREVLGTNGNDHILKTVPRISQYVLIKGIEYMATSESDDLIRKAVDEFLTSKGRIGGMVNLIVGDSKKLQDKIKVEIVKALKGEKIYNMLNNLLLKEVGNLLDVKLDSILGKIDIDSLGNKILDSIYKEINIEEKLNQKPTEVIPNLNELVNNTYIPMLVQKGLHIVDSKIENLLSEVDVKTIVKEQVDTFPVQKLEHLLLGVTKREFKMITYLGFVLGAIIGLIQGILMQFL